MVPAGSWPQPVAATDDGGLGGFPSDGTDEGLEGPAYRVLLKCSEM